jgi:hypothetical protein
MILTPTEFRGFAETALEDPALQDLLDAAEADIVRAAGAPDAAVEFFVGGRSLIALARPAASISSITETYGTTVTTLAADDYLLHPGSYLVERLATGTNRRSRWYGRVTVTSVPIDTDATRRAVQVDLINLALNYNPGLVQTTVGSWSEQYRQATVSNADERDDILSRLRDGPRLFVVGG